MKSLYGILEDIKWLVDDALQGIADLEEANEDLKNINNKLNEKIEELENESRSNR
jgi:hypothetical protein